MHVIDGVPIDGAIGGLERAIAMGRNRLHQVQQKSSPSIASSTALRSICIGWNRAIIDYLLRGVILPDLLPVRDSERACDNLCYRGLQHDCAALRGPFIPHFALNASVERL